MKSKQDLGSRIRGWFPQDPLIRRHALPTTKPTKRPLAFSLNEAATVIIVLGATIPFVLLSNSWIKNWLVTLTFLLGLAYMIMRRHNYTGRRSLKKALVALMAFALCFTIVEVSLFYNAGYPAIYSSATPENILTKESMLNVSTTEILEEIQQSPAFSLLKLEHSGQIKFESLTLSTWQNAVRANFCSEDGKQSFQFSSQDGSQYHLSVLSNSGYNKGIQLEEAEQASKQIDTIGLVTFYNKIRANSTIPSLETLTINLVVRSTSTYDGLIVQIAGYHQQGEIATVISSFQPNGELISKWGN